MDPDLFIVIGVTVIGFSLPSIVGAYSESRFPKVAVILILIGGGLVAAAVKEQPGRYSFGSIPDAFVRVIGRYTK